MRLGIVTFLAAIAADLGRLVRTLSAHVTLLATNVADDGLGIGTVTTHVSLLATSSTGHDGVFGAFGLDVAGEAGS